MVHIRKSHVWLIAALALLVLLPFSLPPTTHPPIATSISQAGASGIFLAADKSVDFNVYCTNGTAPLISGDSATFYGSGETNVYSDAVSYSTVKAQATLVLQASASASIKTMSSTGNDQFAIFAADNTSSYKGDEFGFVLPETGDTWYAYIQSPQIRGFFVWQPVLTLSPSDTATHSFAAVYSNAGLLCSVDFYVDGKLAWQTLYPNVSSQSFHLAMCSHKVSGENVDTGQNTMQVEGACLIGNAKAIAGFPYSSLL